MLSLIHSWWETAERKEMRFKRCRLGKWFQVVWFSNSPNLSVCTYSLRTQRISKGPPVINSLLYNCLSAQWLIWFIDIEWCWNIVEFRSQKKKMSHPGVGVVVCHPPTLQKRGTHFPRRLVAEPFSGSHPLQKRTAYATVSPPSQGKSACS